MAYPSMSLLGPQQQIFFSLEAIQQFAADAPALVLQYGRQPAIAPANTAECQIAQSLMQTDIGRGHTTIMIC